ncbi:MAG: dicarboxylate/amino acid:cation symporter [Alphaproteobacteria bacterium]|nr:MAG: dicarboxylate/amino acid:cation symporter [Alphaproteobacteria bacterium]
MRKWFKIKLWKRVIGGLVLGIVAGLLLGEQSVILKPIGDLFINAIRMLVVPLIFTTLVAGVTSIGSAAKLGSIGVKAIGLYLVTTALAITIGLFFGTVLAPGVGVELAGTAPRPVAAAPGLVERLINIIPDNPIRALADGDVLSIIFFAILFGIGILVAGDKGRPVGEAITSAADVMLQITHMVMELAPFGVFALIAWVAGTQGAATLLNIFTLTVAVYVACVVHMVVVYGGLIKFVLRLPLIRFFRGILDAQAVAFSTSSSSATLPVTLSCVSDNLGVKRAVASSVLPLGATINMDGTALYLGIVALFAAQVFGLDLSFADYLMIGLTATLASVGAAGIPSASLFLLATVLQVIDLGPEETALIVGFIFPFDRILDMARTAVNVTGDAAVAVAVGKFEGQLDEEIFRRPAVV